MIGIYKITNTINGKSYIGLSTHIEDRWNEHRSPYNWKRESGKLLYMAFIKYGIDNFTFEVLEECEQDELAEKERFYISLHDSYHKGYNATSGGENNAGDAHPRHKLSKEDVQNIRKRYANKERRMEVYLDYKGLIGESGFGKIWKGETWKDVMPEVYTEENKKFQSKNSSMTGSKNGRSRLTEQDVFNIRTRRKQGENIREVYKDYADKITYGSFTNVWTYQNWKNIVV